MNDENQELKDANESEHLANSEPVQDDAALKGPAHSDEQSEKIQGDEPIAKPPLKLVKPLKQEMSEDETKYRKSLDEASVAELVEHAEDRKVPVDALWHKSIIIKHLLGELPDAKQIADKKAEEEKAKKEAKRL